MSEQLTCDFDLSETGPLSKRCRALGICRFAALADRVRHLAYGRVSAVSPTAVLDEEKGTCSSKHVFLATVAREAGRTDVELTLGIFEMTERNTPGISAVLQRHGLESVPEAHCYLRVNGRRLDYTGLPVASESPLDTLMFEEPIDPERVTIEKPARHRAFIEQWSNERGVDADHVWLAREACIDHLEKRAG